MAALLRSARLLKHKPPCLLQITGTNKTGVPLGRLYSGTTGGRKLGVCTRPLFPAVENATSRLLPYTSGFVRNYAVATERTDEPSAAVRSKQAQQFDWALGKLDTSVRKTGRITKTLLQQIFHDTCRAGYPSGNQALLLLRSCGSLLPEVPPADRSELAHHIWHKLQELGAQYDVSHYNALLKVYLQNEFKFSPMDFLAKMEAANILPNRVTYQRLIAAYCQNGDIDGASTILGFMKSNDLPITEAVFNSLVTGHACAGDIESAKNILMVMQSAGIEPGPDTYVSLLNAYAQNGDMENMKATLETAESADCSLMDSDFMQVIFTLAKGGHHQHVQEIIQRMKYERGYVPDAMNLCLNLITHGQGDIAFHILKSFPTLEVDNFSQETVNIGSFFLKHCVAMETSVEKIGQYCKELQEAKLHSSPFTFALLCALEAKKTSMSIEMMKMFKVQKIPVRPHFFWPLLAAHVKDKNTAAVVEIVKVMDSLGLAPDQGTLSNYVIPAFPSMQEARQSLKDAGVAQESGGFLPSMVHARAVQNLADLYTLLSDGSYPTPNLSSFRASLIKGFRKSYDVESMAKITELLFTNQDFYDEDVKPAVGTGFFLYNLIESMSETETRAQEDNLRKYFSLLRKKNITISASIYWGIKKRLQDNVPELIQDVFSLVHPKDRAVHGLSHKSRLTQDKDPVLTLEKKLEELNSQNMPLSSTLKMIMMFLSAEGNLQRALELKLQYEEGMTVATYAVLIKLCCRNDNAEEALNLKREMSRKDSSAVLDSSKYLELFRTLVKNGKVEEAVDILKEMKEKDVVVLGDYNLTTLFHAFNSIRTEGCADIIRRLQDTIFSLGLVKPTTNLCSPLIGAYLDSDDLPGALDAAIECQSRYRVLPRIHDIVVGLVEQGDTDRLQKAMDFVSQERGEMIMMYYLFFAFLQTGKYREARKIIETPGLRARSSRLQWYADRCIAAKQMEPLEQMVEMTSKLFECDRDEMYAYILKLCKDTNDWQKAEAMWTKMQEENVVPRERTLHLLADILKNNGQEVPFEVPETWYNRSKALAPSPAPAPAPAPTSDGNVEEFRVKLVSLCKRGKTQMAYRLLKDIDEKGVLLDPNCYDQVIRALLASGALEDAMVIKDIATSRLPYFKLSEKATNLLIVTQSLNGKVDDACVSFKSMMQSDHVPSKLAVTTLVKALGRQGKVASIEEVNALVQGLNTPLNLPLLLFINNTVLAHLYNGDVDSMVEVMESFYTSADSSSLNMFFVFRQVLEEDDKAFDKLNAMAERLANHFACYGPTASIFLALLDADKVDDAKFMLARCNAVAEQRGILRSYLNKKSQNPGEVGKIKNLMNLIPDIVDNEKLYSYLMKCHALDKDLESAKALHEQMQKEGVEVDELSLKRLAQLYHNAGETVPFLEPPESFRFYADKLRMKIPETKIPEE